MLVSCKHFSFHERISNFDGCFHKEDFLDWLLDLKDFFDHMNILEKER